MPLIWLLPSDGRSANISLKCFDRLAGFRRGQPTFANAGADAGLEVSLGESDLSIPGGKKGGGDSLGSVEGITDYFLSTLKRDLLTSSASPLLVTPFITRR